MPANGYFFDTIIRQAPIDEERLDPADNLEEFGPLSEADLRYYRRQAQQLRTSGRAIVAAIGGSSLGDIAHVPAPGLPHPKGIRDITEWYMALATRQDYVQAVFARQCDIALERLAQFHAAVGDDGADVLYVCGTDFGTQTSSFCSLDTFDRLWAPHYRRLNAWVHAHTPWKTMKHSCGAVAAFIPHFIEAGFDILNPLQFSAAGMDPQAIKAAYGARLTLWGGGVNTQRTLAFGTPEAVRTEVLERCAMLAKGGGYVFNAVHCVQANTPIANVVAMLEAVREFNGR
jgi:uroporphyrinogen-III decarboxylase